ncbi:MAG: segregation/condensation protein A [Candidatus Micrarchaeota archaeon]|nr:segregation/condensation protein A [Candidatus Micrarchaeota archaeon]
MFAGPVSSVIEMDLTANIQIQKQFDLAKLIQKDCWKTILIDLIEREKLDPWNIDIVELTSHFIKEIRHMKNLNLSIPANVILASSILLRFKSSSLKDLVDYEQNYIIEEDNNYNVNQLIELPNLTLLTRLPRKKFVTLDELIKMVEEVMHKIKIRAQSELNKQNQKMIEIKIEGYDIEKEMEKILSVMNELKDHNNMLTFSMLTNKVDRIEAFLPLLYLRMHNKILLIQEEFFGEIIICLNGIN